jgi:UDPglucose 6-dehydrogenase
MIGIVGLGFVGGAMFKSFTEKRVDVYGYDKFKNGGIGTFNEILSSNILFLCLPTLFSQNTKEYNKDAIYEVCKRLVENEYKGLIVIKSTIEPETTDHLSTGYPSLKLCHNPEFLTAITAFEDFHNQKHIVLGKGNNCTDEDMEPLKDFYRKFYPLAKISECSSLESESMKIMCNSFYASKIMLFNEYYLLCKKNGSDFNKIKSLMLKNKWINPMHTDVPGPDGKLAYGGACFPKDTQALNHYMKNKNTKNKVLDSVCQEKNEVRDVLPDNKCVENLSY